MNTKNLVNLKGRPVEERQEIARKGAKRSAEVRQQRKTLREELEYLLSQGDVQERVCLALLNEALTGNRSGSVTRAFQVIASMVGEKPTEKVTISDEDRDLNVVITVVDADGTIKTERGA